MCVPFTICWATVRDPFVRYTVTGRWLYCVEVIAGPTHGEATPVTVPSGGGLVPQAASPKTARLTLIKGLRPRLYTSHFMHSDADNAQRVRHPPPGVL